MTRMFDPSDPGEVAAKDQLFTMLSANADTIHMLAAVSKAKLKEMMTANCYLTELQFMCQIVLTMMEECKDPEVELCWPPNADSPQFSPGWKFLMNLVRPSTTELDPEEASVQAAVIFRKLVGECLVYMCKTPNSSAEKQMDELMEALTVEIETLKSQKAVANKEVISGLDDWLWLLGNPGYMEGLKERLETLAHDELCDSAQLEPIYEMQLEIRRFRKEQEDV